MVVWKPNGLLGGFNLKHIKQRMNLRKEMKERNSIDEKGADE